MTRRAITSLIFIVAFLTFGALVFAAISLLWPQQNLVVRTVIATGGAIVGVVAFLDMLNGTTDFVMRFFPEQQEDLLPDDLGESDSEPVRTAPLGSDPSPYSVPASALFVGRTETMAEITVQLQSRRVVVITGVSGVGKSSLALAVAESQEAFIWLHCGAVIAEQLASYGVRLNLHLNYHQMEVSDRIQLVRQALEDETPRLLVFDNCEDDKVVQMWLPHWGGCRALVTSRQQAGWPADYHVVALNPLPDEEAQAVLCHYAPRLTTEEAEDIAAAVGGLPLVLPPIGRYLHRYPRVAAADFADDGLLTATLTPIWQSLGTDPVDQLARTLLMNLGYFAPHVPIPMSFLYKFLQPETEELWEDAQRRLLNLGLVGQDEQAQLIMHPLFAEFAQTQSSPHIYARLEKALLETAKELQQQGLSLLAAYAPHLRQFSLPAQKISADYYRSRGEYAPVIVYQEHYLADLWTLYGRQGHPVTAAGLMELGDILMWNQAYDKAQKAYKQAHSIYQSQLPDPHMQIGRSAQAVGEAYKAVDKIVEAIPFYEQAKEVYEELSNKSQEYLLLLQELGDLYFQAGQHTKSTNCFQELEASLEEQVRQNPNNPDYLMQAGKMYYKLGRYSKAQHYFQRELGIRERLQVSTHPDSIRSMEDLAFTLEQQRKLLEAEALQREILAVRERNLGVDHQHVSNSLNNLGNVLWRQRKLKEAYALHERAFAIRERLLGLEHQDTATSLDNLGIVMKSQGKLEEARTGISDSGASGGGKSSRNKQQSKQSRCVAA